ncbi:MATH domain and coiled-coil domain-containing protein At3g58360-like [Rhodamnia argentea]|uniref:MATH domain and coiled-coil domain-containing protein At3g58360-like n=1 Tax=Rhodamnia argentea TaxID=178133 RepID=A0A8B8PAG6_9MYRT|nr:MATH domain and coiled-coil domain-containing protein At3g58360-like [Rhodamnia argentea]
MEKQQAMVDQNPTSWKYTWKITNFTSLIQKTSSSEAFTFDDNAWRILICPKGKDVEYLSMYWEATDSTRLPSGWRRSACFRLILVDQNNYGHSKIKGTLIAILIMCGFFSLLRESDFEIWWNEKPSFIFATLFLFHV